MSEHAVRTAADALRLDWARDLRWAVAGDPWTAAMWTARARAAGSARPEPALPGVTRARAHLRSGLAESVPDGPLVLGILEDAPLLGTLGNLQAAAGAIAVAQEMRAALGLHVPVVLLLLGGPDARPRPLYALGRDGEIRRVAVVRHAANAADARRGALSLLGTLEAVAGRPWPEARAALERAVQERPEAEDLWPCWTAHLWRLIAGPAGAAVLHGALSPLAHPLGHLTPALLIGRTALRTAVHGAARRMGEAGLRTPEGPEAAFEVWRRAGNGWRPATLDSDDDERWSIAPAAPPDGPPPALRPGRVGALLLCHALLQPSAVVAGDDDVARLVLLSLAIQRCDGAPPAIRPRPRWTLVAPGEAAFARQHDAPLDLGPAALRQARDRAFARAGAGRLDDELQALRATVSDRLERAGREVAAAVPRASGVMRSRSERLLHGVDLLISDVCARRRADDRSRARAWRHLLTALYPFGAHQDEWLAAYPWAAAGGRTLLERLAREVPGPGRRWLRWPEAGSRPAMADVQSAARAVGDGG